jgi:hypothetical protein
MGRGESHLIAPYATPPLLPFFHPPIELASLGPCGRLHLDRRIDFPAICRGKLLNLGVTQQFRQSGPQPLESVYLDGLYLARIRVMMCARGS